MTIEHNKARIEEIEDSKAEFLKLVMQLEVWLEVNILDRSVDDMGVFEVRYQTEDMKAEITGVLDKEIELIREDIPSNYTDL